MKMFPLLLSLAFAAVASAELKLPAVIGSNMVLQQKQAVPIWGWADAGKDVVVVFAGQTKRAKADAKGNWRVDLDALEASFEPRTLVVESGSDRIA